MRGRAMCRGKTLDWESLPAETKIALVRRVRANRLELVHRLS
jgi:hypothetical protein